MSGAVVRCSAAAAATHIPPIFGVGFVATLGKSLKFLFTTRLRLLAACAGAARRTLYVAVYVVCRHACTRARVRARVAIILSEVVS